jgi:uncharacterized protein (TIGR03437 family)
MQISPRRSELKLKFVVSALTVIAAALLVQIGNHVQASGDSDFEFTGAIETLPNTAGFIGDWKVAGRTVRVVSTTKLKQSDGPFAVGKTVKVEGFKQNDNSVNAKEVETKSGSSNSGSFKFYGNVEELPTTTGRIGDWKVSGRTVHVSTTTVIEQKDGPLAVGIRVEVEGSQRADGSVDASKIETEDESGHSGSFEFYGTIEKLPSTAGRIGEWAISGRKVNVTIATRIKQERGAVAVGVVVEVKGVLKPDGAVDAIEIETKSGSGDTNNGRFSEFYGTIELLPGTTGQVGVWTVSGRKVNVATTTVIEHPERGIAVGNRVEVKGVNQADGSVNAAKIEIKSGIGSPGSGVLYGKIETLPTAANLIGDWKVAGKTVRVVAATTIERKYGPITVGAFVEIYGVVQPDGSINATKVEVKQGAGNGAFMSFDPVATVSAASYREDNSPESIVSAFGNNLASGTAIAVSQPLPLNLLNVSVLIDGRQARLFFVSPSQINYQIPADVPSGLANVVITNQDQVVSQGTISVSNAALSLFTADASGQGVPAGLLLRVKANSEQVYESLAQFDSSQSKLVPSPIVRRAGEQLFVILFGSGLRYAPNSDNDESNGVAERVEATLGGINAPVVYAGIAPGYVGLEQVNIRIPDDAISNPNTIVTIRVRDVLNNLKQANSVTISIQ